MSMRRGDVIDRRRRLLLALGSGAGLVVAGGMLPVAALRAEEPWRMLAAAREMLGDARPRTEGITLDLPLVSEEGTSIPLTVRVDSPMNAGDHVEELRVFGAGNPEPDILALYPTPLAGRLVLSTRIRLDESQTVVAVARTSRGEYLAAARDVRVANSGCLARNDQPIGAPMGHPRVSVPNPFPADAAGEVRTLIMHPMETGYRPDEGGEPVPRRIIESFSVRLDGAPVVDLRLYPAVSANPYFSFYLRAGSSGELSLRWTEDTGRSLEERVTVTGRDPD